MNPFKKYYTCDAVREGKIVGSAVWEFWFWQSPNEAHKKLNAELKEFDANPFNFRRIK